MTFLDTSAWVEFPLPQSMGEEGELNANYPKMSRFTHKFREKFEDLKKRHWGKDRHKFGKCAPLVILVVLD